MRPLTSDEMLAVSGGDINGQDDPYSLNGNPGRDRNRGGSNGGSNNGGQSRQSGIQQTAAACPDGSWTYAGPKVEVDFSEGKVSGQGAQASCNRGHNTPTNGNGGESGGGNDKGNGDE